MLAMIEYFAPTMWETRLVALKDCCGRRRWKVRRDRKSNHDSIVPNLFPIYTLSSNNWHQNTSNERIRRRVSAVLATTTPASTSLCPPRYFVAECMTKSAPHLNGSKRGGGAKVASTPTIAPLL